MDKKKKLNKLCNERKNNRKLSSLVIDFTINWMNMCVQWMFVVCFCFIFYSKSEFLTVKSAVARKVPNNNDNLAGQLNSL